MIVVLCGGVGGSRFLRALALVVPEERLTAIINTGDDEWFHGLYVSPDPDIVTYTLAGEVDDDRGWGLRGDTFRWLDALARFGHETWFRIGDRDLATHLHRTRLLREGRPLSQITADLARAFSVRATLLPMSDDRVRTVVSTDAGELSFQEYLVKRHAADAVRGVRYEGSDRATPAPGVLDALRSAEAIFIAPSNPIGSIGPILAVPGIRETIASARVPRIAVSPIVEGRSLQPPAAEMMSGIGYAVSVTGVTQIYAGLIDTLVIDHADAPHADDIAAHRGITPLVAATIMRDEASSRALAAAILDHAGLAH
jgi:LPPG:FO 2-phospho-L-lactate transferase